MTRAVGAASVVTTLTDDQAVRVRRALPSLRAPVIVVPHGVEVVGVRSPDVRRSYAIGPDDPLVVQVAGLRAEKGFPSAFDLVDTIHGRVPALRFVLAGPAIDAAMEPTARSWFAAREWATWTGPLPRGATLDLMAAATCTLHASTIEGLSNAILESMALGVAPVARDIPASRAAVVDGRTGLLFRTDDDAADAVARLAADAHLRRAIGQAAREWVRERFSPEAEVEGYVRVYETALGRPR